MLIQQKYDYKPLERIDTPSGRRYIVGESRPLPSVTTILGATKDLTHIKAWQERVGIEEAERIKVEASTLGTSLHKNIENYLLNKPFSGSFLAQAQAKLIIKNGIGRVQEIWGSEVGVYAKGLYAGTTDLIGLHDSTPAIMDFKNSLRPKKKEWIDDYFMQLTAYAMAHNEMFGTTISKGVVMIATREAKYQEFIIEGDEFQHYQKMWADKLCVYYDRFGFA